MLKGLLENLLNNPQNMQKTEAQIFSLLETQDGYDQYLSLMQQHFSLAFIFLNRTLGLSLFKRPVFLYFLINLKTEKKNCFYIENYLSEYFKEGLDKEIFLFLIKEKNLFFLNCIFKKYRELQKSNDLYLELKFVIEEMKGIFDFYLNSENLDKNQISLIFSIFYSLTYQDLHPYFEDNLNNFFVFFKFHYNSHFQKINRIFYTFVSKYQEIINLSLIIDIVINNKFSYSDLIEVNKILDIALGYIHTYPHRDKLIAFIINNINNIDSYNINNIINNNDSRNIFNDLLAIVKPRYGEFPFEYSFYIYFVNKIRDDSLINRGKAFLMENTVKKLIIHQILDILPIDHKTNAQNVNITVIDIFNYLIFNKVSFSKIEYLYSPYIYFYCKLNSLNIKSKNYYLNKMNLNILRHGESLQSVETLGNNKNTVFLYTDLSILDFKFLIDFSVKNLDQFSLHLVLLIIKFNKVDIDVINYIYNNISVLFKNIDKITNYASIIYLADIYCYFSIRHGLFNINFINLIIENQYIEYYDLMFYYIALNINKINKSFIFDILKENSFYKEKRLSLPLTCILLSLYNNKIITKAQILIIGKQINNDILNIKLNIDIYEDLSKEESFLIKNQFDNYLIDNYLNKKYIRLILYKMIDEKYEEKIINGIAIKNKRGVEYEFTLSSVTEYFSL